MYPPPGSTPKPAQQWLAALDRAIQAGLIPSAKQVPIAVVDGGW